MRVAALLMRHRGECVNEGARDDATPTITTKDRLALVTVMDQGSPHVMVDIGMRMLEPRESLGVQDYPDGHIIDRGHDGHVQQVQAGAPGRQPR